MKKQTFKNIYFKVIIMKIPQYVAKPLIGLYALWNLADLTGCAAGNMPKKVGRYWFTEQYKGNTAEVENFLKKHPTLDVWKIVDKEGKKIGVYAEGKTYGMHFVEVTDMKEDVFDGSNLGGPSKSKLPEGYKTVKAR